MQNSPAFPQWWSAIFFQWEGRDPLRIYHDVRVAVNTVNGNVLFVWKCVGMKPIVCHTAAQYDTMLFESIHGLIVNDEVKQKYY